MNGHGSKRLHITGSAERQDFSQCRKGVRRNGPAQFFAVRQEIVSTHDGLSLTSVVTMGRNIEDAFGKNILHDLFRLRGLAETEAEVPPGNAKRIDVWFVPENNARTIEAPVFTGVLAEIASDSAAIELWGDPPNGDDFHTSLGKREVWHDLLELRDKRPWSRPPLWHICAGKPANVIREFGFDVTTIPGLYRPPAPGWRVHLLVLGELPTTRDTILLRLLGRGRVRRGALQELRGLPDDAWEKPLAHEWLMRLGFEVPSTVAIVPEEREFFMDVHAWYEEHKQSLRDEFMREIEPRLAEAQLQDRAKPLVHLFERRLGRPLTMSERNVLTLLVKTEGSERVADLVLDLSVPDLAAWLEQDKRAPQG